MFSIFKSPEQHIADLPGIGKRLTPRIIEELGEGDGHVALGAIERNPYSLMDVDGVGFGKADKIALHLKIDAEDVRRQEAGNRYILQQKGVLTAPALVSERARLNLRNPEHLGTGIILEDDLYWLPEELAAEKGLARWLQGVEQSVQPVDLTDAQQAIFQRLELDEVQGDAARRALSSRVLALTGGAGCGKTHVIAAIALAARAGGKEVRGMAFAGKAADRMREQFDKYGVMAEATTIHKALEFRRSGFQLEQLAEDIIFIDEASMLPNWLLWAVVERLKPGATLILVGDPNQLPPIGHGAPFSDAIEYGIPRAHLSRNYRQRDQQGILHMAEGVLHKRRPPADPYVQLQFGVQQADLERTFNQLVRDHGGQDFENWQIITYTNDTVERSNLAAQAIINPLGEPVAEYACWRLGTDLGRPRVKAQLRIGDKVLVIKNSTTLEVFNGQTGRVRGVTLKPKKTVRHSPEGGWEEVEGEVMRHIRVEITERLIDVPEDEVEKYLQLGYVITVHKAQGSDWERVIIFQPEKVRTDTSRRFFYTAITRAKNLLIVVSSQSMTQWWMNASADAPAIQTTLAKRLEQAAPELDYETKVPSHMQELADALGMTEPLLYSEWDELRRAYEEHCAPQVHDPEDPFDERNPLQPWPPLGSCTPPTATKQASPDNEQLERLQREFAALELEVA